MSELTGLHLRQLQVLYAVGSRIGHANTDEIMHTFRTSDFRSGAMPSRSAIRGAAARLVKSGHLKSGVPDRGRAVFILTPNGRRALRAEDVEHGRPM